MRSFFDKWVLFFCSPAAVSWLLHCRKLASLLCGAGKTETVAVVAVAVQAEVVRAVVAAAEVEVVAAVGVVAVPVINPAVVAVAVPAAAAVIAAAAVVRGDIPAPFCHVAAHVIKTIAVRVFLRYRVRHLSDVIFVPAYLI